MAKKLKKDGTPSKQGEGGGRPTKFKEIYISKVDEYLNSRQDEEIEFVKQKNEEKGYEMYGQKVVVRLPTIEGFARFIEVDKSTLYEWEENYEEFSYALDKIRQEQQQRLIDKGLSGDYSPIIAKLILSSNHGMKEKSETDITSGGQKIAGINYIVPRNDKKKKRDND